MDMAILQGIHATLGSPVMDTVMPFFTALGEHGILWLAVALVLIIWRKTRMWGVLMVVAMAVDYACVEVLKGLVMRPRPFIADPSIQLIVEAPDGYSFPSGHTSVSFAAATAILFMPLKRYWKVIAYVVAALIAFSRLYLFCHYPTDVLGGLLIGVAAALIVVALAKRFLPQLYADRALKRGAHAR